MYFLVDVLMTIDHKKIKPVIYFKSLMNTAKVFLYMLNSVDWKGTDRHARLHAVITNRFFKFSYITLFPSEWAAFMYSNGLIENTLITLCIRGCQQAMKMRSLVLF